jgi:hypothetical protein
VPLIICNKNTTSIWENRGDNLYSFMEQSLRSLAGVNQGCEMMDSLFIHSYKFINIASSLVHVPTFKGIRLALNTTKYACCVYAFGTQRSESFLNSRFSLRMVGTLSCEILHWLYLYVKSLVNITVRIAYYWDRSNGRPSRTEVLLTTLPVACEIRHPSMEHLSIALLPFQFGFP